MNRIFLFSTLLLGKYHSSISAIDVLPNNLLKQIPRFRQNERRKTIARFSDHEKKRIQENPDEGEPGDRDDSTTFIHLNETVEDEKPEYLTSTYCGSENTIQGSKRNAIHRVLIFFFLNFAM